MTVACCGRCRLRFSAAAAAYLPACPRCGQPLQQLAGKTEALGFRLFGLDEAPSSMPTAPAVSMPIPDPERGRS
jgi:predicted amidophosphoribosyltransferase